MECPQELLPTIAKLISIFPSSSLLIMVLEQLVDTALSTLFRNRKSVLWTCDMLNGLNYEERTDSRCEEPQLFFFGMSVWFCCSFRGMRWGAKLVYEGCWNQLVSAQLDIFSREYRASNRVTDVNQHLFFLPLSKPHILLRFVVWSVIGSSFTNA